jgi:CHAT domain-containing protein
LALEPIPYLGVAAWTISQPKKTLFSGILRAASGPERSELIALPESRHEVESIAADLPKPYTVLLGTAATETQFKHLPLSQYNVLHLALHGYADIEYSDRSALVFAPEGHGPDDGLLQIREIRSLPLKANLVTLSACDTGVGPVGEEGVANIVNAFVEAGAQTVLSTLWELEDHATAHLMTVFYEHLDDHRGAITGLHKCIMGEGTTIPNLPKKKQSRHKRLRCSRASFAIDSELHPSIAQTRA